MQLALFDLDHTLIPHDSGTRFTQFLIAQGALPPAFADGYLAHCQAYVDGRVDMVGMHRYTVGALAPHSPDRLAGWLRRFHDEVAAPSIPAASRALVERHRAHGHVLALVTATSRLVSQAYGDALGIATVLATEPARDERGHVTGEIVGVPCFREHKVTHVDAWLAAQGQSWSGVVRSWFYSDSVHDLPLLQRVSDPVAVNPDARLKQHAEAAGWPVIGA